MFKPASVSGSGKSALSNSIMSYITSGPFFVRDFDNCIKDAITVLDYNYSSRWKTGKSFDYSIREVRHILSSSRSLGEVIALLSVNEEDYSDSYN